jgi:DNA-binding SARP family transcriptional activator
MWLALLGQLCVRVEDTEVSVAAAKQRAVLAALLVRANHVVSFDELADSVWEGAPPTTARATLRNYVKSLRQLLGPSAGARIITRPPGYLARLGEDELDVLRFESLCRLGGMAVRTGDWRRGATLLADALRLWRGAPLADIPSETLRRQVTPQLERLHLQAVEWRIDAELNLSRHAGLILELESLIAEHPLREPFHAQLMLALYRSGRAAEALTAYERARRQLADRLGVDPGPDLRRLHEAILRTDKGLAAPAEAGARTELAGAATLSGQTRTVAGRAAPAVVPRQLPATTRHFAGRTGELNTLVSLVDAFDGSGTVVVCAIDGAAGVGKTALAIRFAHQVAERFPDGQLYVNLRGYDPVGPPVAPEEAIRGFLDALGVEPDRVPANADAQAALYRSLVAERRLLLVLDNARDAGQVRPLLPGNAGCLMVVTSRSTLAGLVASVGAYPLTLDLLSEEEARELLRRRLGAERVMGAPAAVNELIGLCARLPLALSVAASRAAMRPGFPLTALVAELRQATSRLDSLDAGDAASSVRSVFSWSLAAVSEPAGRMFGLLGLHPGPDISASAAASMAAMPLAEARQALTELVRAHLVAEHAPGRFTFHDLLRAYAAGQAGLRDSLAEQQAAIRRVLDHYLHTAHAADRLLVPARDPITLDSPASGVGPETLADCGQALAWFGREHQVLLAAVGRAAEDGFGAHAWRLAWALTTFLDRQGHWAECTAVQDMALVAAQRAGDLLGRAHAHRQLGRMRISAGSYSEAERHLRAAIEEFRQAGDRVGQGRTRLDIARALEGQGRYRDAIGHALEALDLFRAAGHRIGQARALNGIGWCYAQLGSYEKTLRYCQQAFDVYRELGHRNGQSGTLDSLGYAYHHLGHYGDAIECYRRSLGMSRAEGDRYGEADGLSHLGDVYGDAGDLAYALRSWQQALAILDDLRHPDAGGVRAKLSGVGTQLDQPGAREALGAARPIAC